MPPAVARARSRALPRLAVAAMAAVLMAAVAIVTLAAASSGRAARAGALGADVRALAAHHAQQLAVALDAVRAELHAAATLPEAADLHTPAARAAFAAAVSRSLAGADPLWDRLAIFSADARSLLAAVASGRLLDRTYPPVGLDRHAPTALFDESDLIVARASGGGDQALAEAAIRFEDLCEGVAALAPAMGALARAPYTPHAGSGFSAVAPPMVRVGERTAGPPAGLAGPAAGAPSGLLVVADLDTARLLAAARAGMEIPLDAELLLADAGGAPLALAASYGVLADPAIALRAPPAGRRCWDDSFFGCGYAAMLEARGGVADTVRRAALAAGEDPAVVPVATAALGRLGLAVAAFRRPPTLLAEVTALLPVAAPVAVVGTLLLLGILVLGTAPLGRSLDDLAAHVRQVWTDVALPEEVAANLTHTEALRRVVEYVARMLEDTRALMLAAFGRGERYWVEEAFGDIHGTIDRLFRGAMLTAVVSAERDVARTLQRKEEEYARSLSATLRELEAAHRALQDAQSTMLQREKMASLGQLVAGIAHEINNPVNFISQNVEALGDYLDDLRAVLEAYERFGTFSAEQRRAVDEVKERHDFDVVLHDLANLLRDVKTGAERTRKIVVDLRSFSRLDEAEIKEVDIHEGLETTLNLLRNVLKNRIEIVREYAGPKRLRCYAGQLNQVFMNVLNNAQQAIQGSGTVTIRTYARGGEVFIAIRDSGPGVPPDVLPHIFEPFFTTKGVGAGTGLGLSISHSIVGRHGGRIEVDSAPGQGTEFRVVLPAAGPRVQDG
jgi:signal transduction histidine kinase